MLRAYNGAFILDHTAIDGLKEKYGQNTFNTLCQPSRKWQYKEPHLTDDTATPPPYSSAVGLYAQQGPQRLSKNLTAMLAQLFANTLDPQSIGTINIRTVTAIEHATGLVRDLLLMACCDHVSCNSCSRDTNTMLRLSKITFTMGSGIATRDNRSYQKLFEDFPICHMMSQHGINLLKEQILFNTHPKYLRSHLPQAKYILTDAGLEWSDLDSALAAVKHDISQAQTQGPSALQQSQLLSPGGNPMYNLAVKRGFITQEQLDQYLALVPSHHTKEAKHAVATALIYFTIISASAHFAADSCNLATYGISKYMRNTKKAFTGTSRLRRSKVQLQQRDLAAVNHVLNAMLNTQYTSMGHASGITKYLKSLLDGASGSPFVDRLRATLTPLFDLAELDGNKLDIIEDTVCARLSKAQGGGGFSFTPMWRILEAIFQEANVSSDKYSAVRIPGVRYHTQQQSNLKIGPQGEALWQRSPACVTVEVTDTRVLKALNKFFPPTHPADAYHCNTNLASLAHNFVLLDSTMQKLGVPTDPEAEAIPPNHRLRMLNEALSAIPIGTANQRAVAIVINRLFVPKAQRIFTFFKNTNLFMAEENVVTHRLKAAATIARKTSALPGLGNLSPEEVGILPGLDLTTGRIRHKTDWEAELQNRTCQTIPIWDRGSSSPSQFWVNETAALEKTNPNGPLQEEFLRKLYGNVHAIMLQLIGGRKVLEGFEEFYERRHEWVASGSAGGTRLSDQQLAAAKAANHAISSSVSNKRLSKRAWAEMTPFSAVKAVFAAAPFEHATASEKFENGKSRAIYGVEPFHYVISSYATKGMEGRLNQVDGIEKGCNPTNVSKDELGRCAMTTEKAALECTMFDYADFNRQHTPQAQAMIFRAAAAIGKKLCCHPDWIAANLWIAEGKFNMTASLPTHGASRVKVHQGMFSGTRSTDLINTILNRAYYLTAKQEVYTKYKLEPLKEYSVHQGDDVWLTNAKPGWAAAMYYQLNMYGFIFQDSKQMFGPRQGEFLRVQYHDGLAIGYTGRAIVNYVTRPIQSDEMLEPNELGTSISNTCSLLYRRGVNRDGVRVIWADLVNHFMAVGAHTYDQARVRIPIASVVQPRLLGGLGCPPPFSRIADGEIKTLPALPRRSNPPTSGMAEVLPSGMSHDWISHISKKYVATTRNQKGIRAQALADSVVIHNYTEFVQSYANAHRSQNKLALSKLIKEKSISTSLNADHLDYECNHRLSQDAISRITQGKPRKMGNIDIAATSVCYKFKTHSPDLVNDQCNEFVDIIDMVERLQAMSLFKSIQTTMTATGLSKKEAFSFIAATSKANNDWAYAAKSTIRNLGQHGAEPFLEYLESSKMDSWPVLDYYVSGNVAAIVNGIVSNNVLASMRRYGARNMEHIYKIERTCTDIVMRSLTGCIPQLRSIQY